MKTLLTTAGGLALAALLLPAQAQTPASAPASPKSAKPAAAGPTAHQLAPGTDPAVGHKFVEKSKPDVMPTPSKVRPRGVIK